MSEPVTKMVKSEDGSAHSPTGLDTAVLATTFSSVAGAPIAMLTVVAGLPLLIRAILTLQRAGIRRVIICAADEEACRRTVQHCTRIDLSVGWMPARDCQDGDRLAWRRVVPRVGSFLVIDPRIIFSPALIDTIRREAHVKDIVAVSATSLGAPDARPSLPGLNGRLSQPAVLAVPTSLLESDGFMPTSGASLMEPRSSAAGELAYDSVLAQATARGRVRWLTTSSEMCWAIRSRADVAAAERRLLRSLKVQFEGMGDTYLNRPVSWGISRLFLRIRLSPNAITMVSVVTGLVGAATIATGTYVSGVLGALLFQLSAIVDCCDGDVARVTFSESRFGALLDLIGDNIAHLGIFAGVAWSVYRHGSVLSGMPAGVPLALGAAAMLANVLSLWLVMRATRLRDTGRLQDSKQTARVDRILKKVASRDFSLVVLAFALLGWLELFLWIAAIGSHVFWMTVAWITRPSSVRAPTPAPSSPARATRETRA